MWGVDQVSSSAGVLSVCIWSDGGGKFRLLVLGTGVRVLGSDGENIFFFPLSMGRSDQRGVGWAQGVRFCVVDPTGCFFRNSLLDGMTGFLNLSEESSLLFGPWRMVLWREVGEKLIDLVLNYFPIFCTFSLQ